MVLPLITGFTFKDSTNKITLVDETIDVYTITGDDDVEVVFQRTGPDAGCCDVNIMYIVRFNGQSTSSVFYKTMYQGETSAVDHIQGPNPTGNAEVHEGNLTY